MVLLEPLITLIQLCKANCLPTRVYIGLFFFTLKAQLKPCKLNYRPSGVCDSPAPQ